MFIFTTFILPRNEMGRENKVYQWIFIVSYKTDIIIAYKIHRAKLWQKYLKPFSIWKGEIDFKCSREEIFKGNGMDFEKFTL